MSTPQRSRYPRPLKATHTFPAGGSGQPQVQIATSANDPGSPSSSGGTAVTVQSPAAPKNGGYNSPPPASNGGRRGGGCSPEGRSPVAGSRGEGVGVDAPNQDRTSQEGLYPRRSNSMGSLSDPDCYMNSLWPRLTTTAQCDGEDPLSGGDSEFNFFSHKRSSSCSGADRLNKAALLKVGCVPSAHTRTSIEGLNQEVSSALEGNPILLVQATPPDGRIAPVRDLLGSTHIGTQTPPLSLGFGHSISSQNPSPFPLTSSPSFSSASSSHIITSEPTQSGISQENPASFQHPSSPKPSFAREPPDGAERCTIKETSLAEGYVSRGPDKSKGNIVFKGTAFAPLLAPQKLQPVV